MDPDSDRTEVRASARMSRSVGIHGDPAGANVLPAGTRIGEFEITDLIAEGGFGIVYLAYDHSLDRHVALKEYMPGSHASRTEKRHVTVRSEHHIETFAAGLRSFVNEAKLLAQFDSPSLVKVYRFWEANGTAYMVMPFYDGITLKQALKERRIMPSEEWIKSLLASLCDAVETIHRVKCYHRDIAPDNILLLKNGQPVLLDFSAARRVIGDLTQGPTVVLKPGYAPIEQYADIPGLKQGPWTDVYALAAVVYFLITGKSPPPAVSRVDHDDMLPARQAGQGRYSPLFLVALDRALAVRPENRIQTVAALRRELQVGGSVPRTVPLQAAAADQPAAQPQPKPTMPTMPAAPTEDQSATATWTNNAHPAEPVPAPQAEWMRTMSAERRDMPPLRRRGKGKFLALGVGLCAGVAGGLIYWRAMIEHQRNVHPLEPLASRSEPLPERSAASTQPRLPEQPPAADKPAAVPPPEPGVRPDAVAKAPAASIPGDVAAPEAPAQRSAEEQLWRAARKSDRTAAYSAYLDKYPKGRYAAAAKQKIERSQPKTAGQQDSKMPPVAQEERATPAASSGAPVTAGEGASPKAPPRSQEDELWSLASTLDQAPLYETYLGKYPDGRYADTARDKLAKFSPVKPGAAATAPPPPPASEEQPAATRPGEPSQAAPKAQRPQPPAAAPEPPVADARKTYRLDGQTMVGDFNADPATGAVSGRGKITWNNGDQFEGTLVRGVKQGKGQFTWANGQRYNGDWARDKPNGRGTIIFANGNRYEGDVRDGTPHGKGKFSFNNGNRYEGDVKDGTPHGKGTFVFASGDRYEGEVREGVQHGEGISRFARGDVYAGSWAQGKRQGYGRYSWPNGSYWEGQFRDGKMTENGRLVSAEDGSRGVARAPASGGNAGAAGSHAAGGYSEDMRP